MLKKVYLEIGNLCNLNCAFCPGTCRPPRMLTVEEFLLLTDKLRGKTQYLYFHLMGEPLLHPELGRFLSIAGDRGFRVMITTNGVLLPEKGELLLSSPSVHKVNISLQSFEGNLIPRYPSQAATLFPAPKPCAGSPSMGEYVGNCIAFAERASASGILCEFRLWNKGGWDSENAHILSFLEASFPKPWISSRTGQKLAEKIWLDCGERFDWPDLALDEFRETGFCYGLRDQIGVLSDGTVVPCCLDHDGDIPLGNLFSQSLDEILNSPRAKAMYEGFSSRNLREPLCRRCGYAARFNK